MIWRWAHVCFFVYRSDLLYIKSLKLRIFFVNELTRLYFESQAIKFHAINFCLILMGILSSYNKSPIINCNSVLHSWLKKTCRLPKKGILFYITSLSYSDRPSICRSRGLSVGRYVFLLTVGLYSYSRPFVCPSVSAWRSYIIYRLPQLFIYFFIYFFE